MSEVKKSPELKPEVLAISEMVQGATSFNKETKNLEILKDIYEKTMPEGLTPELSALAFTHLANFTPGASHGVAIVGMNAMAKNKGVDELTLRIPLTGNDTFDLVQKREKVTFKPRSAEDAGKPHKPEDEVRTYGAMTGELNLRAGNPKSGQYKVAMTLVKEAALEALGK